jgi:fatty-acyl-CoA synthase
MRTIPDFARQRALLTPDAVAFQDVATERTWKFEEIDRLAEQLAAMLEARELVESDRVAVLCHNTPMFFALLFAAAKAALILVPLNWRLTASELGPILADCDARLLLHDEATSSLAEIVALEAGVARLTFDECEQLARKAVARTDRATTWPANRVWYLLYTSGTTGKPKAVIQTPGMALANYVNVQQATGVGAADGTVNFLPLFHTAGINLHALPVFIAGGSSHVLAKFDIDPLLDLIEAGAIRVFFGVPAIYQAISLHPRFRRMDFSHVRHWGCGGAPLPENLIHAFLAKGALVCNGMGMTETGPTVFLMDPAHARPKIGSVGKPQIMTEVRLVDAAGEVAADGQAGEIQFRGANITPGYFNNPEATAAAFDGDWLKSGDVGRRDADGYYFIIDRIKDMYISGGENVYPAEVETVLHAHPAILEAAVIGVPDARWGEVGHAHILLRPDQVLDAVSVRDWSRTRLAGYKVPLHVTFVGEFPRTAAGKIQKHVLRRAASTNDRE